MLPSASVWPLSQMPRQEKNFCLSQLQLLYPNIMMWLVYIMCLFISIGSALSKSGYCTHETMVVLNDIVTQDFTIERTDDFL